jgi:uncharacterized FlaG/YvyC family protein
MGINPVPAIPSSTETQLRATDSHSSPPVSPAAPESAETDSVDVSKQESSASSNVSGPLEMPQDEVEVQRDSQTNDEIVVRYMDHAGNVILQIPSEQVLGLTRAIEQDFEREGKVHAEADAARPNQKGGKTDAH